MPIYFEITDTPDPKMKGHVAEVFSGLKIGRKDGQLIIQDGHMSGFHAQVEQVGPDRFVLVDQDSHNGIMLNGRSVKKVTLLPDVHFMLGSTSFKVIVRIESLLDVSSLVTWQERFRENLRRFLRSVEREKESLQEGELKGIDLPQMPKELPLGPYYQSISPFPYPVKLQFLFGPQAEVEWQLGYGPRRAGFYHFDLQIIEPQCPNEIFEIRTSADQTSVEVLCFDTDFVKINGQAYERKLLEHGDRVSLGKTEILITFARDYGAT